MSEYSQENTFQDIVAGIDDEIERRVVDPEFRKCIDAVNLLEQQLNEGALGAREIPERLDRLTQMWREAMRGKGPSYISGGIRQVEFTLGNDTSFSYDTEGDPIELSHYPTYIIGFSILGPKVRNNVNRTGLGVSSVVGFGHINVGADEVGNEMMVLCAATMSQIDPVPIAEDIDWRDDRNTSNPMHYEDHFAAVQAALTSNTGDAIEAFNRLKAVPHLEVHDGKKAGEYAGFLDQELRDRPLFDPIELYDIVVEGEHSTYDVQTHEDIDHAPNTTEQYAITGAKVVLHQEWERFEQRFELQGETIDPATQHEIHVRIPLSSVKRVGLFQETREQQAE